MAYNHHPCRRASTGSGTPAACYCHCYCATYTPCHHPPPSPPPPVDSYLHHPAHQPHLYSGLSLLPQYEEHYLHGRTQTDPTISSLLRRIAALESALRRRSSHTSASQSLREAAARTIQIHFRAFLSRRSRTLRHLKHLASIKSTLGILKFSVSEKTHFDYDVVYHKAMKLLLKLDTIQGDDPLIRNGKSSISRELDKFLNFIEGISSGANVRDRVNVKKSWVGNMKIGDLKRVNVEKMRVLAERIDRLAEELDEEQDEVIENSNDLMMRKNGVSEISRGVKPKVKKSVRFAENAEVYQVLRRRREPFLEEGCSGRIDRDDDGGEIEDDLCQGVEEIGVVSKDDDDDEEVHSENGGSLDGEKGSRSYSRCEEGDGDDFVFSSPSPLKMEKRGY